MIESHPFVWAKLTRNEKTTGLFDPKDESMAGHPLEHLGKIAKRQFCLLENPILSSISIDST
jgi:hypothetical protein